jgi:hypothetical protein
MVLDDDEVFLLPGLTFQSAKASLLSFNACISSLQLEME